VFLIVWPYHHLPRFVLEASKGSRGHDFGVCAAASDMALGDGVLQLSKGLLKRTFAVLNDMSRAGLLLAAAIQFRRIIDTSGSDISNLLRVRGLRPGKNGIMCKWSARAFEKFLG
jgi:hypothetical protein